MCRLYMVVELMVYISHNSNDCQKKMKSFLMNSGKVVKTRGMSRLSYTNV